MNNNEKVNDLKEKLELLKNNYITIRSESKKMKHYVSSYEDIIKLEAGITTFDLIIEDLEKLLK